MTSFGPLHNFPMELELLASIALQMESNGIFHQACCRKDGKKTLHRKKSCHVIVAEFCGRLSMGDMKSDVSISVSAVEREFFGV